MSKQIFRYLRGELNGFYLTRMYDTLNKFTEDLKCFLIDFHHMQFNGTMPEETVYNLGKFAGVFLPRLSAGEGAFGSMRMTDSYIVGGKERSERGLMNREQDDFIFHHTAQDVYAEDINHMTVEGQPFNYNDNKSSLVDSESEIKGYMAEGTIDLVMESGDIDEDKVLATPPDGKAYSDYYGNGFLYIESTDTKTVKNIDVSLFLPLFKVMQYIRYNGVNIVSLCKLFTIIVPEYVTIDSITKEASPYFKVKYTIHQDVALDLKTQRLASLLYIIKIKFPQFYMEETVTA